MSAEAVLLLPDLPGRQEYAAQLPAAPVSRSRPHILLSGSDRVAWPLTPAAFACARAVWTIVLACLSLMWIAGGAALYSLFPEWCEGAQESVIDGTAEEGTYEFANGEMCIWAEEPGMVTEVVDNMTLPVTRFDNGDNTMVPMQAMMLAFMIGSAIAFFLNIFGFMMIHTFNANGIKGCAATLLAPSLRL